MKYMNTIDVFKTILGNKLEIEALILVEFENYNLIQERIDITSELNDTFMKALQLREEYNLPFWDGFNLNLFNKNLKNFSFLKEIQFHNKPRKKIFIYREDFNSISTKYFSTYTGISSRILIKNNIRHIPMLDFHIPVSNYSQKLCENIICELNLSGYLLESGKSYHFIGNNIISHAKLKSVLHRALLFTPVIDRAWIAHQLIQNYCCLRISHKYDRLPKVVSTINV